MDGRVIQSPKPMQSQLNFVLLDSDPRTSVENFEVLLAEKFAGIANAY